MFDEQVADVVRKVFVKFHLVCQLYFLDLDKHLCPKSTHGSIPAKNFLCSCLENYSKLSNVQNAASYDYFMSCKAASWFKMQFKVLVMIHKALHGKGSD